MRKKKLKNKSLDITQIIAIDHQPLKVCLNILKNEKVSLTEKKKAFRTFVTALTIHAHAEERSVYDVVKDNDDLRKKAFEGELEHQIIEQLILESIGTHDEDLFCAQMKVLADLVDHHLKVEEGGLLRMLRRMLSAEQLQEMGGIYRELKTQFRSAEAKSDSDLQKNLFSLPFYG